MIVRPTVRLLVLDAEVRVLLFRCEGADEVHDGPPAGGFWVTPGGGVEDGETSEDAARRELREETGIVVSAVGPCLQETDVVGCHPDFGDEEILYRDQLVLVRLTAAEAACLSAQAVAEAGYAAHRWWTVDEIETTIETVQPDDLAVVVRRAAAATTGQAS